MIKILLVYLKIKLGKFEFPIWFTESQRNLISKMLNPTYKQVYVYI